MTQERPFAKLALAVLALCIFALNARRGFGQPRDSTLKVSSAEQKFFESKIRPVLVEHCYKCHGKETQEGGLRLDTRQGVLAGGDRGPLINPEPSETSLLIAAIGHLDPDLQMPPDSPRLAKAVITDFRDWIRMGAPDPRRDENNDLHTGTDELSPGSNEHWAYKPLALSKSPPVKKANWPVSFVDHYILAALEQNELAPSSDAPHATLIRRLQFDLIGLPPTPEDVQKFAAAINKHGINRAMEKAVDRLLESKRFGERWGKHWLDVARFGESSGGESNVSFPYAWRYRDYVIDAFNADIPYDRFLTEQIAGDLLQAETDDERARLLTATGFLAVGPKNLGENNDVQFKADLVDEQIDALTRGVLGSSIACARCHNHKFDPFSMRDYYSLAGIFSSTETFFGTFPSPANNRGGKPLPLPRVDQQVVLHKSMPAQKFSELKEKFAALDEERSAIQAAAQARLNGKQPERVFTLREVLANIWRIGSVEGKLATLDESGKALPLTMGVLDSEQIGDSPLLQRGEVSRPGDLVPRGFPDFRSTSQTSIHDATQSGRMELAQWLTSQPLTSRVYVNRIWQHLFGEGLVRTVDDFGTTGASPSHVELLDQLARRFVEDGWSTKSLIKELALSHTYRQASTFHPQAFQQDPENHLLWRMPKKRLEAELIRDAILFVSGEIDLARPDGSLVATPIGDRPIALIGLNKKLPRDLDGARYRSVYLPVIRDRLPDVIDLFDGAEPSLVTGKRTNTNVPVQALFLMNSSFMNARASAFADRLVSEADEIEPLIRRAFLLCFAREPDASELRMASSYIRSNDSGSENQSIQNFLQALMSTAEFRILD